MHARDEFRRRNLVEVLLVRVVAVLQIVARLVAAQVRGVRVRRQAAVVQRLIAAVRRDREVVRVAVVDQVAVSVVALAKKLVVSVVANLTNNYLKHRRLIHRVRHRHQKALL